MKELVFSVLVTCVLAVNTAAAGYAQAGALAKDGHWEVSVVFDSTVAPGSVGDINNFHFNDPQVSVDGIRYEPLDKAVVLSVSNLSSNSTSSLTVSNIQDTAGTALPAATLSFSTRPMSWVAVGDEELGFAPDAVAVGDTGLDLVSGGSQMRDTYDESTFAYETVTGNFDRKVRVISQEPSSMEARAGLMVRESLDAGRPRPSDPFDPAQAFSRYIQVEVTPDALGYEDEFDQPANNYEVSVRFYLGGIGSPDFEATEVFTNNTAAPDYPNAWVRIRRSGQTFTAFRGTDGTNWVSMGSYTFPTTDDAGNAVPPFSDTVFLGPNYSPETLNIPESSGARRAFLAQFRDYGVASGGGSGETPELSITRAGQQVEISWSTGSLEGSTNLLNGSWIPINGVSPLRLTPDKKYEFFRARNP